MVPEIVFRRHHSRVNHLEMFDAGELVIVGLLLRHDGFLFALVDSQFGQHLRHILDSRMLVGTTVVFVGVGCVAINDLGACVGRITLAFTLFSVHVAEIVGIFLVEILADKHAFEIR